MVNLTFNEMANYKIGRTDIEIPRRIKILMNELNIDENDFSFDEKIPHNLLNLKGVRKSPQRCFFGHPSRCMF